MVKEYNGVWDFFEWSIQYCNACAHHTSEDDQANATKLDVGCFVFCDHFEFVIINMPGRACEKLILVLVFGHCDYDHGDKAENHAQDFDSIDSFPVVIVA